MAQDPSAYPNHRVLGVEHSSYRGATQTLKTLGTSVIKRRSKHTKTAQETAWLITGSTDVTEPAAGNSKHWLIRCKVLSCVGSTDDATPDRPTKSNQIAGVVVQRDNKLDL